MRLWREGIGFELHLQLRRPTVWILAALFLFPLFGVTLDRFQRAIGDDVLFGAPISVAESGIIMGLVAMVIVAAVAGDAATRDVRIGIEPLMQATPVGKSIYLGGRFCGAFCIAAALFAGGPLAHALVPLTDPDLAQQVSGPFRPFAYIGAYGLLLLPNAFVATTVAFATAALLRHPLGGWVGILLLLFTTQGSHSYLGDVLGRWELAQAFDASGATTLDLLKTNWTASELDTRLIPSTGSLLLNRAIWLAVSGCLLILTYRHFDFGGSQREGRWWQRHAPRRPYPPHGGAIDAPPGPGSGDMVTGDPSPNLVSIPSGFRSRVRQTLAVVRDSLRELAPPWLWLAAPALVALQSFLTRATLDSMGAGTPVAPSTSLVVKTLLPGAGDPAPPVALATILLPILMAGELVWRERDAKVAGLTDTAPVPAGVWFAGKVLALWLIIGALLALIAVGGVLAQTGLGGRDLDPRLYIQLLGLGMVRPMLFALFAFSVHVMVNRKHLAHVIVLFLVVPLIAEILGIEHPLMLLGSGPNWHYSPISGFAPFLASVLWFDLYWAGWALLTASVAYLFWVRGLESGRGRLTSAVQRSNTTWFGFSGTALGLVLVSGAVISHNLNVPRPYRTASAAAALQGEYERRYAHLRSSPQPHIVATDLRVEIFPNRGEAQVAGVHHLQNRTGQPLDSLHVATSLEAETQRLQLDRSARTTAVDDLVGHRTYVLDEPLAPGDSLRLEWAVEHVSNSFSATDEIGGRVIRNGTAIRMQEWIPRLGYQFDRELIDRQVRRSVGLPPRTPLPRPDAAATPFDGYGRDHLDLSVTVGTSADQIAVAPGELVRTWTEDDRSYFRYETAAPVGNGYGIFSARYRVATGRWQDVAIEVLHHPEHDALVETMVRSMERSLDQLTDRFGPYPYRALRMIEYPSPGGSLHAASGSIWYQELFSQFDPARDPQHIDLPFAVVAHEVAHQFQPVRARMEGQALLSESFAWYGALGVVEDEYGEAHLRRLLDFMRRTYLTPRSRAGVPLLRANDAFLGYRKGPFAMYALREYVGEDRIDQAWRRLRERHASHEPPYARSVDLYRELQRVTPDSLQTLLGDLLERNTYWDLETHGVTAASTGVGAWQVSIDLTAHKATVDSAGVETPVPMDDLVEVGVYGSGESEAPLYLEMHRIRSGRQTISVAVPDRPARAGIDPRHLLIDVEPTNNVLPLSEPSSRGN